MTRYLELSPLPLSESSHGPEWLEEETAMHQLQIERAIGGPPSGAEFQILRFYHGRMIFALRFNLLDPEAVAYMAEVERIVDQQRSWTGESLRALGQLYEAEER